MTASQPQPPTITPENQKQEALAAFTATLHSVGTNLEQPLRDRAATITANEAALQRQEAELAEHTARLAKQNASWAGLADETREGLKEIGDVQNWAEMIERDLLVLEEMMDGVERGEEDDGIHDQAGGRGEEDGSVHGDEIIHGNGKGKGKQVNGNGNESKGWLRWW
ncbi:hypothetical protein F1880_003940 [Penicillium rolfsii]|nr:hypothetical protein F1880_003940 [Penicillium rolfsii]